MLNLLLGLLGLFGLYVARVLHKKFQIWNEGKLYLTRFHLWIIPDWLPWPEKFRRCFLHRVYMPDPDRHLHNHPWPQAFSFILWGGYSEYIQDPAHPGPYPNYRGRGEVSKVAFMAGTYHRISWVKPNTWTLFFAGKRTRSWGFLIEDHAGPLSAIWVRKYHERYAQGTCTVKSMPVYLTSRYTHIPWTLYLNESEDKDLGD